MATKLAFAPAPYGARLAGAGLADVVRQVKRAHAAHVSRRELAEMEPRMLRDIGLTAPQAMAEVLRAPWDLAPPARPRRGGPGRPGGLAGGTIAVLVGMREAGRRWRTRRSIAELDGHLLRDIGVSYAEAENEANKPFWRR